MSLADQYSRAEMFLWSGIQTVGIFLCFLFY